MPSFNKILSNKDVKKQMAVGSDFAQYLPWSSGGGTVNFEVMDAKSEKMYEFGYYIRSNGHPKPVFQGGWHDYRRDKGLKVGDRIIFWADDGNFRILAERKIKLMGKEMWADF